MNLQPATQLTPDQKFWIAIWKIIATVAIVFILGMMTSIAFFTSQKAEMIKAGKNPLEIACAFK